MTQSSERQLLAPIEEISQDEGRPRRHRKSGRRGYLRTLLEQALLAVLQHLDQRPHAAAQALLRAVRSPELFCARLDLLPPLPVKLADGEDVQFATVLAEATLPQTRRVLHPHSRHWPAALPQQGALVVLPLVHNAAQIGLLTLWVRGGRPQLSPGLDPACQALACALLSATEQKMLREHIQSMHDLQQAMLEVGASLDMAELQSTVVSIARRIFNGNQVWFLSYDEAQGLYSSGEMAHPLPESAVIAIEKAVSARSPFALTTPDGMAAFACSNVTDGTQQMGILLLQREQRFSRHELDLLAGFALSVAEGLRNARIYQDAQETFAELRSALDQLIQAERLRALGEIARGVAHDFNNLLTIISSHTQFLLESADEEQTHELEQIRTAIREGAETVNRLREFTRAATQDPQQRISLNKLILQVYQLIRPLLNRIQIQRNATISIELDLQTLEDIPGNPGELREMLLQMVHNSLDALPHGGKVWVRTWQESTCVCLQIRDDGVGMAEEVRRRVFDPFFTTKAMRGSGLGLSMVHGVVRRHSGTIDVDSIPGIGSTFTIRLPLMRGTFLAESSDQQDPNSIPGVQ